MNNINLELLIKDHEAQWKKTFKWNGFDDTKKGKKNWELYSKSWEEWDKMNIVKLNLKEYLGEKAVSNLIYCLNNNKYNMGITFNSLVNELEDGSYVLNKREETLEIINNWVCEIDLKKISYYCCLRFKTNIKKYFYAGSFLPHNENMNINQGVELLNEIINSNEGFMPTLSKQIENLIGENNFISDFYEFGQNDFGLYWDIRKDIFENFINKFLAWIKYEELQDYFIYYSIYDKDTDKYVEYNINKKEI